MGGTFKNIIEPLSVIQKNIIKIGLHKNRQYPSELLFKESGIFTIRQLFIKTLLVYTQFNKSLIVSCVTHNYSTRNALNIGAQVPRTVKAINFTNAFYLSNILYRNIPGEIRDLQVTMSRYKSIVAAWLLETGPERSEDLLLPVYAGT